MPAGVEWRERMATTGLPGCSVYWVCDVSAAWPRLPWTCRMLLAEQVGLPGVTSLLCPSLCVHFKPVFLVREAFASCLVRVSGQARASLFQNWGPQNPVGWMGMVVRCCVAADRFSLSGEALKEATLPPGGWRCFKTPTVDGVAIEPVLKASDELCAQGKNRKVAVAAGQTLVTFYELPHKEASEASPSGPQKAQQSGCPSGTWLPRWD